jgi:predicted MPP superfamily phosphohydrolase
MWVLNFIRESVFVRIRILFLVLAILTAGALFLNAENNSIEVNEIKLSFKNLPKSFNGFRIVHLSDLHSKFFGDNQQDLISKVRAESPDIIVITGDMVNSKDYIMQTYLKLINGIKGLAPIYWVTGNHEIRSEELGSMEYKLKSKGVKILSDENDVIEREGYRITILGVDDPLLHEFLNDDEDGIIISKELEKALEGSSSQDFKILLSHRPELISYYSKYNMDLIFSGHAHGGQIRLPFIGGLYAPNQGFFPKYTSGKYQEGNSTMVVSRGLGNSVIPQRLFNRPEIVVVEVER